MRPTLVAMLLAGFVVVPGVADGDVALVVGAVGHSLMNGWNADAEHIGGHPEISWPTGDPEWSFSSRIGAVATENVAVGGAPSWTFADQVDTLANADFVLVGFIGSGLCLGLDAIFGPPPPGNSFEADMREGLRALAARDISALVTTVPDWPSIAEAARWDPPVSDWTGFYLAAQECGLEPGIEERQRAMNEIITRVAEEEGALHDRGAIATLEWTPDMVSDVDGLHASPVGLAAMAQAVWDAYDAAED